MDLTGDLGINSLQRLKSLCKMLRENADKILMGNMGLTINSTTLNELNEAVDNLQDGLSPPHLSLNVNEMGLGGNKAAELEEWNFHLQLVLDIVAKAPVLLLYREKGSGKVKTSLPSESSASATQPVRLGHFTSLKHLEINCVAIDTIQDLLKMRERLETLVVTSCFSTRFCLQNVLEICDQGVSVPMQWTTLRHLSLRCNGLTELDGSLRLCPRLEVLDLSRNKLVTTDEYLGYLTELSYVDLSYNRLTKLPIISATAKRKMRVLLLTGNKLTDLTGMEDMTSLEELDVSENLISCHRSLIPLRTLHRLDLLCTKGCPASVRKDHRLRVLKHISTVSLSRKFFLDGRPVTHKEIQRSRIAMNSSEHSSSNRHTFTYTSSSPRRAEQTADGSSQTVSRTQDASAVSQTAAVGDTVAGKKRGRRKAKARMTEIHDMDTSTGGDQSSTDITPSTTPNMPSRMDTLAQLRRLEMQEKRAEMEHLRSYYGNSWLQAVLDQHVFPRPASIVNPGDLIDGDTTRPQTFRKSASEGGDINRRGDLVPQVATLDRSIQNSGQPVPDRNWSELSTDTDRREERKAFNKDFMFNSSGSGLEDDGTSDLPAKITSVEHQSVIDTLRKTEETFLRDDDSQLSVNAVKMELSVDASDTMIEPEDQSEPFIVTLANKPDEHRIVTVSPRYLVEKDINGAIQDKLDMQSLEAVRMEVEEVVDKTEKLHDSDSKEVKVFLDFSYIRKDRRSRVYVMEDFLSAQHFIELIQPFLDAKIEAAIKKLQVQYQCLKCNNNFTRGQVHTLDKIPQSGSSRDFTSIANWKGEDIALQCPKCSSDHVVLLEADTESIYSIGCGSLPSEGARHSFLERRQSVDQVMIARSPKAHSTPLKLRSCSSDSQFIPEDKGFNPNIHPTHLAKGTQVHREGGDGPSSAVSTSESKLSHKTNELTGTGRQRSSAFYGHSPIIESMHQSKLNGSAVKIPGRQIPQPMNGSFSNVERTDSSNCTLIDAVDGSPLATFGALNNLHLAATSKSSDWVQHKAVMSSAESDITILNKRDSVASVIVLSSADSSVDNIQIESPVVQRDQESLGAAASSSRRPNLMAVPRSVTEDGKLSPVQQEPGAFEGTPVGSPLSSSICSSMVSSVYHNSLLPIATESSAYVTTSDHSINGEAGTSSVDSTGAQNERSIYDQDVAEVGVEVLSEEEDRTQLWPTQHCEDTSQVCRNPSEESDVTAETTSGERVGSAESWSASYSGDVTKESARHLHHRLALYLMMTIFENDEEFKFKIKCSVCQYMIVDEFEALVVVTNMKLYILKINTEDESVELTEGLTLAEVQPLAELRRVDVGLGCQTLRLEFCSDCSSYTLILRDDEKLDMVKEMLSDHLQMYAMETGVTMSAVFSEGADQDTLDNLSSDVLTRGGQVDSLRAYILGYIARGHNPRQPMAFVVSSSQVCLVKTNHQWPSPQLQTLITVETVGKQFTVLERQNINNIATVEVHKDHRRMLQITFFNETSGDETQWLLTMETEKLVNAFIEGVRGPWQEAFGVDMDVEISCFEWKN